MSCRRPPLMVALVICAACHAEATDLRSREDSGLVSARATASAALQVDAGARLAPSPRARKQHRPPAIKSVAGAGHGFAPGGVLASDQQLLLAKGEELVLDFEKGARVRLIGPARAAIAVDERDGMMLKEGLVSIDLGPSSPTPDGGFTLVTPSGELALVRAGRLAVRTFGDGSTTLLVASGNATVSVAQAEAGSRQLLGAGDQLALKLEGPGPRSALGALTLEQALARVAALRAPRAAVHASLDAAFATVLTARSASVRAAIERERALVAEHRTRLGLLDADVMGAQTELATHAAQLARQREGLALLLRQRAAARLGVAQDGADELAARARELLPRPP